ncbi:bifunctional adenosylcobinamide kinase/adenosylcobinamide-phosphate guanylyltransferase [Gynuella sunshinyii]|uniref:Bifunctional adenosylcobalamin biosynthesis protein n=1 Tax=Gynuella sunshinyii YC6258 TaxID=1445510 RepID=A0A0C5VH82_9GAMM|nr:bifunctional adenosylcobinamide kinase/adenosylcobinamide-phosphate guanylyltransferase [Gynuella sunshinyii]AJQ93601.1 adenosyl cobinamide kinase/adenosyl cobinamide phosphate guanylyltransferase [Gynuella sunshinyii YC6258]
MIYFYLGGARSGKSRLAEQQTLSLSARPFYIATAQPLDEEMQARIAMHQAQRDPRFQSLEAPLELSEAIQARQNQHQAILVDCLTLWLSNQLFQNFDQWPDVRRRFLDQLKQTRCDVVLVSNEVGQGIVPMGKETRRFVDEAGWLHQDIAAMADQSFFIIAGKKITLGELP